MDWNHSLLVGKPSAAAARCGAAIPTGHVQQCVERARASSCANLEAFYADNTVRQQRHRHRRATMVGRGVCIVEDMVVWFCRMAGSGGRRCVW